MGLHITEVTFLILTQQPGFGFDTQQSQNVCTGKIINFAEVNQWRWFEENGQWLENIDKNPSCSGKPVLQK